MLPYFETVLEHLKRGDPIVQQAFGEHVHWGYWENPRTARANPEEFHRAAESMLEQMAAAAGVRDGARILDVGCGLGGTINSLNRRYRSCVLVGVNIDERQLAIAHDKIGDERDNSVQFVRANACALPFRSEAFDIILCVESIFHFPSRQIFIDDCERILRPGGVLVISDMVPIRHLGKLLDAAERSTRLVGKMYGEIHTDISKSQYRSAARASGMECVSIRDITTNTLPTYRFLRSILGRTDKKVAYDRATFLVELLSKMRLLQYLILVFRKPQAR